MSSPWLCCHHLESLLAGSVTFRANTVRNACYRPDVSGCSSIATYANGATDNPTGAFQAQGHMQIGSFIHACTMPLPSSHLSVIRSCSGPQCTCICISAFCLDSAPYIPPRPPHGPWDATLLCTPHMHYHIHFPERKPHTLSVKHPMQSKRLHASCQMTCQLHQDCVISLAQGCPFPACSPWATRSSTLPLPASA